MSDLLTYSIMYNNQGVPHQPRQPHQLPLQFQHLSHPNGSTIRLPPLNLNYKKPTLSTTTTTPSTSFSSRPGSLTESNLNKFDTARNCHGLGLLSSAIFLEEQQSSSHHRQHQHQQQYTFIPTNTSSSPVPSLAPSSPQFNSNCNSNRNRNRNNNNSGGGGATTTTGTTNTSSTTTSSSPSSVSSISLPTTPEFIPREIHQHQKSPTTISTTTPLSSSTTLTTISTTTPLSSSTTLTTISTTTPLSSSTSGSPSSQKRRQRLGPSCDSCRIRKVKCNAEIQVLNFELPQIIAHFNLSHLQVSQLMDNQYNQHRVQLENSPYYIIFSHDKFLKFKPCKSCITKSSLCCFSNGFTREDILLSKKKKNTFKKYTNHNTRV